MSDAMAILDRFHRLLVEEISTRRPDYLGAPFTVAEIYQNLVPYGSHRDRLGVDMNGDYEHALVRLLAGEGGYLVLESEAALKVLRAELRSSNPNTGIYREYAAVDVRLNPALAPGEAVRPDVPDDDAMPVEALAPPRASASANGTETDTDAASAPTAGRAAGATCRWCRAELPHREGLRFCPFCGTDVNHVPCPGCGEELEPEWRFCIACGTEVEG